jgi:ATP-binding cassette subfamily F protein uup
VAVILGCRDLAKSYDVHALFEGVALGIEAGDRMGIIGPNGSGKSTLLRILAGLEIPDAGERALASGVRLVYLAQRDEFAADATPQGVMLETLAAAHPDREEHARSTRAGIVLGKTGFGHAGAPAVDQPVATLSGGWRKRLAIARALVQEPDLLLMDEPTNHLDLEGIWWLERTLADAPFTYAVVSHDRFFLERVCSRVVELNRLYPGGCFTSQGGYSAFLEKRAAFVANQQARQEVLDNRVRREIEWLQRNPAAQTCKSKARVDQAGDLQAQLAGLKYRNAQTRRVDIDFTATGRRTNDLVVLDGVSKQLGGKPLFSDVELTLSPGTRLGVLGLNGSGKTTFLKVLAKQLAPDAGRIKHASELKIVVFDQKRERLDPSLPLRRALCPSGETVIYRDRGIHIAAWARRFLFSPAQLDLAVGKLSGGEQARVLIADLMRREADLLVLDEPTNDLDIPSLEVLEASLLDFPGAVVLVTHDRYLLDRVSNSLIALDGRGGAYQIANCAQWEDLAGRIQAERDRELAAAQAPAAPPPAPVKTKPSGLSSKERREFERMGERIEAAEQRVRDLEASIADPAVAGDPPRLQAACAQLAQTQAEVEALYARWAELESKSAG